MKQGFKKEVKIALINNLFVKVPAVKKIFMRITVACFFLAQAVPPGFAATPQPTADIQAEMNQPQTGTLTQKNSVAETAAAPLATQIPVTSLDFLAAGTLSTSSPDAGTKTLTASETPEVVIPSVAPPPETVSTRTITLGGTKGSGQSLWISSNDGPYTRVVAENNETTWSASVNLVNGANDLRIVAADVALNMSAEVIVPTVTYSYTVVAPTVMPPPLTVSDVPWTVLNGVKATGESIWISSNSGRSYTPLTPKDTATTWSASVKLVNGINLFSVIAKDTAANPSAAVTVPSITYTVTAPTVTPPPATVPTHSVTLSGRKVPGESIWISSDGGRSYTQLVASNTSTDWSALVDLVRGDNHFTVLAEDVASNTSAPVTVSLITCTAVTPMPGSQTLTLLQGPTLVPLAPTAK